MNLCLMAPPAAILVGAPGFPKIVLICQSTSSRGLRLIAACLGT
jgi:hypothetical protein